LEKKFITLGKKTELHSPTHFLHSPTRPFPLPIGYGRPFGQPVHLHKKQRIMESENKDLFNQSSKETSVSNKESRRSVSGRVFAGLIIVTVGSVLLAKQMGIVLPYWLISWPMLLVAGGIYLGFRHAFRGPVWIVMILVGTAFLLDDIDPTLDFRDYVWPVVIIAAGVAIMVRPQKRNREFFGKRWEERNATDLPHSSEDYLDSVTIFGGIKKNIFSKEFKGGDITTIFGGTELNLSKADMQSRIELDITQIFGGAKLIVPPHWTIKSEDLVSIFGGVEDKRPILADANYDSSKVLILKGTNIFGGIDIKSY
jgi:hypothetical protein